MFTLNELDQIGPRWGVFGRDKSIMHLRYAKPDLLLSLSFHNFLNLLLLSLSVCDDFFWTHEDYVLLLVVKITVFCYGVERA